MLKTALDEKDSTMNTELNMFNNQDHIVENKERCISHLNRSPRGGLPKKVCNTSLLDNEVEEGLGSVGEEAVFIWTRTGG